MNRTEVRQAVTGPFVPIWTPFNKDGTIDFASLRSQIDFSIAAGSKTLLLTYGDSLMSILTDDEIAEVTKVLVQHTARRAMVIAADRQWATPKEVQFARYAREVGADALLVLPPDWAGSCTIETMVEHYAAVAKEIPMMVVTAAFPSRGARFGLEVLKRLIDRTDRMVGIKDDYCGLFAKKMALQVHNRVAIYSGGQKQYHYELVPYGCDGYMSTFLAFKPEVAHRYWKAVQSRDEAAAIHIIKTYDIPFYDFISGLPGGFDAGIHGCFELFGVGKRWRRPPYYSLNDQEMEKLAGFFRGLSLL
jgi:dihydrodipicolinate synthase/N-acetylneuraminate lyase